MQTFLPYDSFRKSAQCLDYRRLGKQRVECKQILNALYKWHQLEKHGIQPEKKGWMNHPAVLMWKGYENFLGNYMQDMIAEWVKRGYKNTMVVPWTMIDEIVADHAGMFASPWWLGYSEVHESHQSNLLRKDTEFYGQFNWSVDDTLEYIWPVNYKTFRIGTTDQIQKVQ